jgi:hypothetical protein
LISPFRLSLSPLSLGSPAFFDHRSLLHVLNFAPLRHEGKKREHKRKKDKEEKRGKQRLKCIKFHI